VSSQIAEFIGVQVAGMDLEIISLIILRTFLSLVAVSGAQ